MEDYKRDYDNDIKWKGKLRAMPSWILTEFTSVFRAIRVGMVTGTILYSLWEGKFYVNGVNNNSSEVHAYHHVKYTSST